MKISVFAITAAAALFAAPLFTTGAQAADVAGGKVGNAYAGLSVGWVSPEDVNFSGSASSGGYTSSAAGKFEFKDGYSVTGAVGYRFNDYLRAEGEIGYTKFDYDKVTLNGTITNGSTTYTVAGSAPLEGEVSSWIGMVNGIVAPLGKSKVTPLIGGGIGFAATDEKITRIGTTAANLSSEHTDLALNGLVGVEASVTTNVDLGVRYRYYWVDSGDSGHDDFTAHNLSATAAFKF